MQRLFSLLLVCCILGQASVRTLLSLHYQLDRAAYLQKCENKDKPKLHCDGKCYLKKQMGVEKNDASKEPKLPESFREMKDLQLFCESLLQPSLSMVETSLSLPLPPFQFSFPVSMVAGIFRPPAFG